MSFRHGKQTKVFVDEFDLSTFFNEASTTRELELADTTTFGAAYKTFLAGFLDATASVSGFFDPLAGASDVVLAGALSAATAKVVTICRESADAVGDRCEVLSGLETSYEISSSIDDAVAVTAEFQSDGGLDAGVVLHAIEAETADANEASVDNLASSANGGVGHLHASAFSGFSGVAVFIEHSPDNSAWATLVAFTSLAAVGKQRVVVAAGTTVDRYLRARTDVTGSGSITYAAAFARR